MNERTSPIISPWWRTKGDLYERPAQFLPIPDKLIIDNSHAGDALSL